jgi:CHAT domain-containing protein/Tfp pilus assembly protein PilF
MTAGRAVATRQKKDQMRQTATQAMAALESGKWRKAQLAFGKAIRYAHKAGDLLAEALFRSCRGQALFALKCPDQAREEIEHALTIAQSESLKALVADCHYLLAQLDFEAMDDSKAIDRLFAAIACEDDQVSAQAFGLLGEIYLHNGWFEAACDSFRRALSQDQEGLQRARWLGSIGLTLAEMGQLEDAVRYYRDALSYAELEEDKTLQAKCLANEGLSHFHQQRYQQAIECYTQALNLSSAAELSNKSAWLDNLGNVYLKLGDSKKALTLAKRGLAIAQKINDRHSQAARLDSMGDCLLEQGQCDEALSHYAKALSIGKSIKDRVGERVYLANMARAHKRLGDEQQALSYFRQAVAMFEQQRSRIHADTWKTSFAATGQNLYRDTIQTCLDAGNRTEALEYVGRAKSRAILELLRNSPIDIADLDTSDQSISQLVAREKELSRQIARLERLYSQTPPEGESGHRGSSVSAEQTPQLYSEWREVVDQLKQHHRNYATMVAVDSLRFDELKTLWNSPHPLLSEDTAVLEFFLSDQFLFAATIWKGCAQPITNVITDNKQLADLRSDVTDFLEMSATEGWAVPVSLCKRLYEHLVSPLVAGLPNAVNRLLIIPHGILHRVPFAALHDGRRYLIERYSLSYLPTASLIPLLAKKTERRQNQLRYLVSAISDYSATRNDGIVFSSRLRSAAGLEDLSYTLEEGQTVHKLAARHAPESRLLTNEQVKEGLLTMFADYAVVHFAGHAVFNPEEPLASGLVLADGSILTAARILQDQALRTNCGKLLVLSACQTGVNVVTNGGEILGLARALMYAGMPNLILSLWEVADRSTSTLMQDFHSYWQVGKGSIADALAEAQRAAVRQSLPIHAWAPFVHLGID